MPTFTLRRLLYVPHLGQNDLGAELALLLFDSRDTALAAVVRQDLEEIRSMFPNADMPVLEGLCKELSAVAADAQALDRYYRSRLRDASLNICVDDGETLNAPTFHKALERLNRVW